MIKLEKISKKIGKKLEDIDFNCVVDYLDDNFDGYKSYKKNDNTTLLEENLSDLVYIWKSDLLLKEQPDEVIDYIYKEIFNLKI